MEDYKKLVNRLREEPKDSRKAVLSIYDLCVDAACAIESLLDKAERDIVTKRMIELEQEVFRLKSRLAAYEDTGLEPEQVMELKSFTQGGIHKADDGWKHVQELLKAEQDGRLVILPEVSEKDRKFFADGLHDYFLEAKLYDQSVGIFGMTDGEAALADALMEVLEEKDGDG